MVDTIETAECHSCGANGNRAGMYRDASRTTLQWECADCVEGSTL